MKQEQGALFIVSGPSGVGKTTVVTEFLKQHHQDYQVSRMVTYTTKTPRSTEVHGIDYHFITQLEFEQKVAEGFFLEWSCEYGACYGTPKHVLNEISIGKSYVLVIDRVGAAQIVEKYPYAVLIWIQVSSIEILSNRLNLRKTDSFDQIQARLFLAKKEIEQELTIPMYHHYIMNDDLKTSVERVSEIVLPRCFSFKRDII